MTHIAKMVRSEVVTEDEARTQLQEGLEAMTPEFDPVFVGKGQQQVVFEVMEDRVLAVLTDPFGCIVAMGEVVL